MSNSKHKYADILIAIANGEQIQSETISNGWFNADSGYVLSSIAENENIQFRVKPKTININGFEVPEPIRGNLQLLEKYYTPCISVECKYITHFQGNNHFDDKMLDLGIIHSTPRAAKLHAEALLSFTKGKA